MENGIKMKIILSPIASNHTTEVFVDGLNIIIDGQVFDLSVIPEGGYAECDDNGPFIGKVQQDEVTIKYFFNFRKAESVQSTNWDDYTFLDPKGKISSPIKWVKK